VYGSASSSGYGGIGLLGPRCIRKTLSWTQSRPRISLLVLRSARLTEH
ncbi:unnamed protein product, partial [Musa acuminata var. zebrina]